MTVSHKGKYLKLAPHIVYWQHDQSDYRVDALTLEREGKTPHKPKIDSFKVSEFEDLQLTNEPLSPHAEFDPGAAKYAGKTVCVIQVA